MCTEGDHLSRDMKKMLEASMRGEAMRRCVLTMGSSMPLAKIF